MSIKPSRRPVGIGPALAMVDAVDRGRHGHIKALVTAFGTQALTDSVTELTRRMLTKAEVIDDYEALMYLHDDTHARFLYHRLDIGRVDRVFAWTHSLIAARKFMCEMVNHYIDVAPDVDNDTWDSTPEHFVYPFTPTAWIGPNSYALGLAYATTLLVAELAEYGDHDFDDVMGAYRAIAAAELVLTAG